MLNKQFLGFLDRISRESGQTALCEAVKEGYKVCCESDETPAVKHIDHYELDPNDPAKKAEHKLTHYKVGDNIEHYRRSDYFDAADLLSNSIWDTANDDAPIHTTIRNYLMANRKGPLNDDEVKQIVDEHNREVMEKVRQEELAEQKRRKYNNPKRFHELLEHFRGEYENACDDLYYGYGFNFWYNDRLKSVLSEDDARIIWHFAFKRMANAD